MTRGVADGRIALPAALLEAIARDADRARAARAVLDLELHHVARGAPAGAATAIVLKGPAVARRWPDPELRPYGDIDLLVPESELGDWATALERLGFAPPAEREARRSRLAHHHLVYRRGSIALELHWRLFAAREARRLDYSALAAHAVADRELGGLLVASLPAQLVVLAVHLAHHRDATRRLVWTLDFVTLGEADAVAEARRLAEAWGVRWALEAALHDVETVLGEPRWGASPERVGGLARARRSGAGRWRTRAAKVRAIGVRRAVRYAKNRVRARRTGGSGDR